MRTVLKILGAIVLVLILIIAGVYVWASAVSSRVLSRTVASHSVDFPVPFPIDTDDPSAPPDAQARQQLARAQALERGRYLIEARYACLECHGENAGGGVMVDAFPIGSFLGPNLTTGRGSRTINYTPADWDRIVRHGIRRDGKPAVMPSEDFIMMSDQELSDIVVYLRSMPPVDNDVPESTLGPLGKYLVASGNLRLTADLVESHHVAHATIPPPTEATVEFGAHVAAVCSGCHRGDFSGGPVPGGDPSWPPARNLTPHDEALGPWTYEQFVQAMRNGVRPDGTEVRRPMTLIVPFARKMKDIELEALWLYLRSIPAVTPAY